MMRYDNAATKHFLALGISAEFVPDEMTYCGFAAYRDDVLCALAVVMADKGRWWASLLRSDRCPAAVVKQVEKGFKGLASAGVEEVWANVDHSKPGAQRLLEWLGFEPVDAAGEEWRKQLIASGTVN